MNLDDLAKLIPNAAWRLPEDDGDPQETREWLEALDALIAAEGPARATFVLKQLLQHARTRRVPLPQVLNTPYLNTISLAEQAPFPGNLEIEQRLSALVRWNALAMVVRANHASPELGGHIASYASAADLFEVGFNHFFRASGAEPEARGDLVFFQPHSAPGVYARAFLEGRLTAEQLDNYRRETGLRNSTRVGGGAPMVYEKDHGAEERASQAHPGPGLSSYPHPWLMPNFWQFPTGSMGLGPLFAIYQARFLRYLENRGLAQTYTRKVWAFVGDGEMDEPESLAGLSIAGREGLDNLVFVVNCNLQRLDGPVRGNGSIIQELEGLFAGAGWNVIKLLWGSDWDPLFARDTNMLLLRAFHETVDGEFQTLSATDGRFNREHFFNKYPELAQLTAHLSDDDIDRLRRGGHDPVKIHASYHAAVRHRGQPTVILAKTKKGYGMGSAGQGRMTTHQQKKLDAEALREFRDRFALPLTDAQVENVEFQKPGDDSPEMKYMHARRIKLGGYLPVRASSCEPLATPSAESFARFALEANGKEMSTTMASIRMLGTLLKDSTLGPRIVPIIADEARTFGMADLFRQVGIYSPLGQLYEPEDSAQISYYKEAKNGQILEEGINEAGAIASWVAAGTSYSTSGVSMLPFYIFYSMFGFQRVGDLLWAAADSRTRGFLLGATAGRTTLSGEGLQHEDGTSHLIASTIPNCRAYDPCYAHELAVIVEHGMRRMLTDHSDEFYYLTVMNENYAQPSAPGPKAGLDTPLEPSSSSPSPGEESNAGGADVRDGILRGLYRVRASSLGTVSVRLLGSGTILREALAAAEILETEFGTASDVYSVTSYTELRREAMEFSRAARLGGSIVPSWIDRQLPVNGAPVIAASDYVSTVPDLIRPWIGDRYVALGTDGFGRSDTRAALRAFFEVDRRSIALAALHAVDPDRARVAREKWGIAATPPPWSR